MTAIDSTTAIGTSRTVAVVGTGTMGQGIAQVALVAGHPVRLHDAVPGRAQEAAAAIGGRLDRLVEKGRMTSEERDAARGRLLPATDISELSDAALVVEAVLERLTVKQELFTELEKTVADDCLLATNTSSLSVTAVAGALRRPGRFVGLHFFNPAPLLPLVEVVSGHATEEAAATAAQATVAAWGKTPVRCADTPGFIVNRVARPFYAEAFAVHEERGADPATIDAVLRECGGFKMGAFELTDLIGQDVNEAVTRSVWDSFFQSPKFHLTERERVGRVGPPRPQVRARLVLVRGRRRAPPAADPAARRGSHERGRARRPRARGAAGGTDRAGRNHRPPRRGRRLHIPSRRRGARAGGRGDVVRVRRRDRLLRPRPRLREGDPYRPFHIREHAPEHARRGGGGRRSLPGPRQGRLIDRGRTGHDRRPYGGDAGGLRGRRGRPRCRVRPGHRHRDEARRQLPGRTVGVGREARVPAGARAAGRPPRALPHRSVRTVPGDRAPRLRGQRRGGRPM
ncbi:LOW QUALITY PROTEIN: 3-hydroxybutyryl-CoA dehydrogenase, partial [Streptomyces pristinaespiralis ATCC 25486]